MFPSIPVHIYSIMLGGRRVNEGTLLWFLEAFIWLLCYSEKILNTWIATALCVYVGLALRQFISRHVQLVVKKEIATMEKVISAAQIMTRKDVTELIAYLNAQDFRFTKVNAEGPDGNENLVFTVVERDRLDDLLKNLKDLIPTAFYTVERVKAAAESGAIPEERGGLRIFTWLRAITHN
ncbi:MAG: hypothetical protein U5K54_12255 [Cytophagales bacterium]|nr:hypothetical protein [Cytophagales bacterium]